MALDGSTASFIPYTLNGLQDIAVDSSTVTTLQINSLTPNRVVVSDGSNFLVSAGATSTEVDYLSGTTSNVQTQLNTKASTSYVDAQNAAQDLVIATKASTSYVDTNFLNKTTSSSQSVVSDVDFTGGLSTSAVYARNGYYIPKTTFSTHGWSITRQINGGILKDLLFRELENNTDCLLLSEDGQTVYVGLKCDYATASKIPVFDVNKKLVSSGVDAIKLTYLDNVSSDIQTQLNNKLNLSGNNANQNIIIGAYKVQSTATPTVGDDYTNKTYVDSVVSALGALYLPLTGGTMTGDITMGANKVTSTANPATDDTLTRKGYVDSQDNLRLLKAGDTMTGDLIMGANKVTSTANPATDDTLTRKGYVDSQDNLRLLKAGDTMTGDLIMGANKVTSTANPATDDTLTRKGYVDTQDNLKANLSGGNTFTGTQTYSDQTANTVAIFNGSKNLVSSTVTSTTLGYLDIGSSLTSLLNLKADLAGPQTFTGTHTFNSATPITLSGLTASRVLTTDGSSQVAVSTVTTTELGYLSGVTSGIQSQLNGKLNDTGDTSTGILNVDIANAYASRDANPLPSNFVAKSSSQRLYMGAYYTGGAGACATIQASDFYSAADHGTDLLINPLGGNVGFNQSSPQWLVHCSRTNDWDASVGGYSANKAQGILALGGKDNDPDYQYIIFPNPSKTDSGVAGMAWWSADMITGRYKNEFRLAWWKETHGGVLGSAYKEGITLFLTDAGGYNNLDWIKLNGKVGIGATASPSYQLLVNGTSGLAGQVDIGVTGNTVPNIKFANSLSHIDNNAGEVYLFTGFQGHLAIGRNTNRDATTANLCLGVSETEESQLISVKTDNSDYMPMSFAASRYAFTNGAVNIASSGYAVPDLSNTPGQLVIGGTDRNYVGGWASGLLAECQDRWEFSVHDSGLRLTSFLYYDNNNTITIGRDTGWGTTPTIIATRLQCNGSVGIGTASPAYNLDTIGSIRAYGNEAGGPSIIISQNDTAGDGYAVFHCRNNSGSGSYWFHNSSTRVGDGGPNTATLRNDIGVLRLQSQGLGMTINTNGSVSHYGGDTSITTYGPNATWSSYLRVGAGTNAVDANTAQVISTNGNLHLDGGLNKDIYIGYYPWQAGQANNILSYSRDNWTHQGAMNVYGNFTASTYSATDATISTYENIGNRMLFRDGGGSLTVGCCSFWQYTNSSIAWTYGTTINNAFYVSSTSATVQIHITGSGYGQLVAKSYFFVSAWTGTSYYTTFLPYFFNITSNHTQVTQHITIPSNAWGSSTIGYKNIGVSWVYDLGTVDSDANDTLQFSVTVVG